MAKSCPITRSQFRSQARPIKVTIHGRELEAAVKEFSTGSLGWNINEKMTIELGGIAVSVQIGLNLTIIGSKELPAEAAS